MKYLVSHQGQESGPFLLEEIVAKVRVKELELFDYIYDESASDWVLLMEFAPLAKSLKGNKPGRPPAAQANTSAALKLVPTVEVPVEASSNMDASKVEASKVEVNFNVTAHTITEWFILKGENRFGPFNYTDLVKMLQQKVVFPFDFVWHTGMADWARVAEVSDFQAESIRNLFAKADVEKTDVFVQRRFDRKKYSGRVIIHDGLSLWRGEGVEISKGGVGVTMQNAKVVPGQQLTLHFTQQDEWPAFNATCEVVSKKFVSDSTPVEYGLRFLSLSKETQDELYKKVA